MPAVGGLLVSRIIPVLPSSLLPALRCPTLDELEALGLVVGQASLKQHRVHAELRVQQGHVAVHLDKEVDALVALVEMRVVVRQRLRAAGAAERPTRCHLVGREKETGA